MRATFVSKAASSPSLWRWMYNEPNEGNRSRGAFNWARTCWNTELGHGHGRVCFEESKKNQRIAVKFIHPQPKAQPGGGWRGLSPPLSDQNIDVYFLSFSPTLYCKSRSGALQNVLWQYHRRSNTFVIKPNGYEFSRFEKYWSSFLHSCVFCTTIHNKSWVLPCSASVETSMTFELPTVSIDV